MNSVIVEPTATAAHDTIEITTPDSPEDTTLVDKTVIIKDTITVNVSSYDLYQTDDEEDTTIDTSITERVVGHTGINKVVKTFSFLLLIQKICSIIKIVLIVTCTLEHIHTYIEKTSGMHVVRFPVLFYMCPLKHCMVVILVKVGSINLGIGSIELI